MSPAFHHSSSKRRKSHTPLPSHLLIQILLYLPISHLHIIPVHQISHDLWQNMQQFILSGAFFAERERVAWREVIYKPHEGILDERTKETQPKRDVLRIDSRGVPQTYHDLHYFQMQDLIAREDDDPNPIASLWSQGLRFLSQRITEHLTYPYSQFSSHMQIIRDYGESQQRLRKLWKLHPLLVQDRRIMKDILQMQPWAMTHLKEPLRSDEKLILLALTSTANCEMVLYFIPKPLRSNRSFMLKLCKYCKFSRTSVKIASKSLLGDVVFMREVLRRNPNCIELASDALKGNKELATLALKRGSLEPSAAQQVKGTSREVAELRVQKSKKALKELPDEMRADKYIVLKAVGSFGMALQHASMELRNDKDVVLRAVQQKGKALQYASPEQREDRDVVLSAVQENGMALKFASESLRQDVTIVKAAVQKSPNALRFASESVRAVIERDAIL